MTAATYRPIADAVVSLGKMHFDYDSHSSASFRRALMLVLEAGLPLGREVAVKLLHGLALARVQWQPHLSRAAQDQLLLLLAE